MFRDLAIGHAENIDHNHWRPVQWPKATSTGCKF
jgi:hypothetical protein